MPYRVFLAQIGERLRHTYDGRPNGYETAQQFRADVHADRRQPARQQGRERRAISTFSGCCARIDTFGFHVATLDVRQHTERASPGARARARRSAVAHALAGRAPRAACRCAGARRRARARSSIALGKRTLGVFEAMVQGRHRYGAECRRLFRRERRRAARTTCSRALLLARWAEAYDKRTGEIALDVAPLFESVDTLERCGDVMRELLAEPVYRRHLEARGRRQCVLDRLLG